MGLFNRNKSANTGAVNAAGTGIASVLPDDPRPWYKVPHLIRLNLIILIPLVSSSIMGYDGSMMNGLQSLPQWRDYFDSPRGALLGALNSVYPAGKFFAMFLVTWVTDRYGRKVAMSIGIVTCIAFAIMQGVSQNFNTFIASRAILGFCTSFLAQPSPILISELAYPLHRGKLTALYQTCFYLGAIIAAWCTFGTFKLNSTWAWRIPSIMQGFLPFVQLCFIWWVPESPRWLAAHGRGEEARKILVKYHGGGDENSPLVAFEMAEIEAALELESTTAQNSWFELVRTPANRHRTLIAIAVGWFAQWTGMNLISYYLTLVLDTIGITSGEEQTLINGLLQISNWLTAVFVGAMMIDRAGRRTLFLISTSGLCISYCIWTALTASFQQTHDETTGRAVVAFVFIASFFYAIAWSPLQSAYTVEIFPYRLRSRGVSVMYLATFAGLVTGSQTSPMAMRSIGWRYYIFFCVLLAVIVVIIYFLFPETKGHTLEEIREVFEGKDSDKTSDVEEAQTSPQEVADKTQNDIRHTELAEQTAQTEQTERR